MLSKEFITERGRNSSDEFAVDPNAKPAEIPAWLKKAGTWLGNKIGLKEPVALPDYTASNQQDAAARSGYTGIDPVQRQQAGMAPATQQEINRYMRDNPAVVGGLTDRNGNPIASGGAQEVERAARAAAPRRGADFDVDAEVGAVDPAVIGNRFKTPRELGFQPGGSTTPSGGKPGESTRAQAAASTGAGEYLPGTFSNDMALDRMKAAAGIPAAVPAAATPEVEIGAPIPARSLKANTQPAVKKSFDEPVAAAAAPMKGGYGSGMNNPSVAQQTRVSESDTNRILELAGLLKSSEFLNEADSASPTYHNMGLKQQPMPAPGSTVAWDAPLYVNPSDSMGAPLPSGDPIENVKAGIQDAKEFYDLARKAGMPIGDAIPLAYKAGVMTATGDIGGMVQAVTATSNKNFVKGIQQLKSTIKDYTDLYAQMLPTSEYYKKNIAPNPQLKAQADEFIKTNMTPQQFAQSIQQAEATLKAPSTMPTQASPTVPSAQAALGRPASQPAAPPTNETTELNRILQLSGMELIAEGSTKSITVQRGDTLSRIAADNSTTVSAIVKLNNIANPDRIYPGDVIRIPGGQGDPGGRVKRQAQSPAPDIDSDTDTDSDNSSRVERAWLNMIAREESSDDYNAINFEAKKAMKKGTMRITGKPGQHPFDGQSGVTAAGRYQMLYNTWKTAAKLAGVDPNDFSPKNQDRAAFALAKNEYKRKYPNRDLVADLQDPKRVDQAVRWSTGPWSVEAGGPGFSTQDYVSALSDIRAA